jgi:hypothetical protein
MTSRNQTGQMTIEMILLVTILFGLTLLVSKTFNDEKLLHSWISGPWSYVAGMAENGVWMPPSEGRRWHANVADRRATRQGDKE